MPESRKIAAILAADVVGYSRLASADEDRTLARLRALRSDLIDPTIAVHNGRVVKRTGDGILVEFRSVVDAVRCAIEVQSGMIERNAGLRPERRIEFRVGIHLGDVVEESDSDLMGSGVNIAARLEGIAKPGAICLSEDAYRQVKGRLDLPVKDLGEIQLKNIAEPVRAYELEVSASDQEKAKTREGSANRLALPDKPSIAVLPFQNIGGDPEQEYFADGMVEEITTALSRIRWLFVIARNSAFIYKGKAVDIKQVGRELGVRYVLEGSVRKGGARVRITAQLLDAGTGAHLWADRYDRDLIDIFAVQDEITSSVAAVIEPALAEAEQKRVLRKAPENLDAWEAYQRGLWHFYRYNAEGSRTAKIFFQRAIELDPTFAPGHYGLALAEQFDFWLTSTRSWSEVGGRELDEARTAVLLDDRDPMAHAVLAFLLLESGEWEAAVAAGRMSVSLNPNSAWCIGALGNSLGWSGYHLEGVDWLRRAMRGSPHDPLAWLWKFWIGIFNYFAHEYVAALEAMQEVARVHIGHANRWIAASLGQLERFEEAKRELEKAMLASPEFDRFARQRPPWMRPEDHAHMVDGLCKAGWQG